MIISGGNTVVMDCGIRYTSTRLFYVLYDVSTIYSVSGLYTYRSTEHLFYNNRLTNLALSMDHLSQVCVYMCSCIDLGTGSIPCALLINNNSVRVIHLQFVVQSFTVASTVVPPKVFKV